MVLCKGGKGLFKKNYFSPSTIDIFQETFKLIGVLRIRKFEYVEIIQKSINISITGLDRNWWLLVDEII